MRLQTGKVTRRTFVVRGGWAALASVGIGILAACSSTAPAPSSPTSAPAAGSKPAAPAATTAPAAAPTTAPATGKPAAAGRVQLPTYVAPKGPAPDVPGTEIIPPGFLSYPKSPTQTVATPPGDG